MSGNFHTSGYATENDLKTLVYEHNDKLNLKIKSTLRKIHKLKRENLVLGDVRKSTFNHLITLKTRGDLGEVKMFVLIIKIMKISERIGKNGNKIQRLRTKISQLKKRLIPLVDEWFNL